MSFIYPLALLSLIGIPIVIIIYIIKNKYLEQIIPSTYLWTLSERFLKKKKQIKSLSGIISLILQILIILLITLTLAQPIFRIPNKANDYCFIIDSSGSMNMEIDDETKLELGKKEVKSMIEKAENGSTYTLIQVGTSTNLIYEKIEDKEKACELLNKLEPTESKIDFTSTIKYVQNYFNNCDSLKTYLITDTDYNTENIEVINVSQKLDNYAITNASYIEMFGNIVITGDIISYTSDQEITLELYIDNRPLTTLKYNLVKGSSQKFEYVIPAIDFSFIEIKLTNEDNLMMDNTYYLYNLQKEHDYSALIVSDRPFYLESMLNTLGNITVDVVSREVYSSEPITGYSLYIFDSFSPYSLPTDGTIWLFGAATSVNGSGFSVQDVVKIKGYEEQPGEDGLLPPLGDGMLLSYANNSTSEFKKITNGISNDKIYVAKYVKYGFYRNFNTVLTHNGNPVVFTGTTDSGNNEVVFAFDLHDSNLPLLLDYIILTQNLLGFSFPNIIEKTSYVCGETAVIYGASSFKSIRVEKPHGKPTYLSVNTKDAELVLDEVGTYKITIITENDTKVFTIFVSLPEEESNVEGIPMSLSIIGEPKTQKSDGKYDDLIIFFCILAVIFVADWMVYCYEQHQLR